MFPYDIEHDEAFIRGFILQVRNALGASALDTSRVLDAQPGDPKSCLIAKACLCEIGGSDDPEGSRDDGDWVMRFESSFAARAVAETTGQVLKPGTNEVMLPEELTDLAVSFDLGRIEVEEVREMLSSPDEAVLA